MPADCSPRVGTTAGRRDGRHSRPEKRAVITVAKFLLGIFAVAGIPACTATNPVATGQAAPVNYLEVSARLVTSGQLTADQISALDPAEYPVVINLAPGDVDGMQYEAGLLAGKGIAYVAIPVEAERPDYREFVLFSNVLQSVEKGRVWVHCRSNYRSSVFAFLYRVIHEGADPDAAYEKLTQVWIPTPHWLTFVRETLARHKIAFDF